MKKILFIFLLFFLSMGFINAEMEITDFRCVYDLKTFSLKEKDEVGTIYVDIHNYSTSFAKDAKMEVFYKNEAGNMVPWNGGIFDYYHHDDNSDFYIGFKVKAEYFVEYFTNNGKCSPLQYIHVSGGVAAEIQMKDTTPYNRVLMEQKAIYFQGPEDADWVSEEEFKKRDENPPEEPTKDQKDLTCKYTMRFATLTLPTEIIFKKKFNTINGKYTYAIDVDSTETAIDSVDKDLWVTITQFGSHNLVIKSASLKTIFSQKKCKDALDVYQYSDGTNYYITLDCQEAKKSSHDGKIRDGSGGDPKDNCNVPKTDDPDIDITHDSLNCEELLGDNLTAILRAALKILQIAAAIILIVKGMIMVIPAVAAKDEKKLKEISGKLIIMAIILLVILLLPTFIKIIGGILDFDLSCFE